MSVNKVILVGRLGKDPELSRTKSGTSVAKFPVATDRFRRGDDDTYEKETEWHHVVVFGRDAENCEKYLSTGSQVFVEGRLEVNEFEGRDGNPKSWAQIIAANVRFLGGGKRRSQPSRAA